MSASAVIYVRQSKDTALTGQAIARQLEDCRKLCAANGWTVVEVFEENDTSASGREPRPMYARMMELVDAGTIDVIVAWHVDRLTRRLADLEDLIGRTQRRGVRISTVNGELDLSNDTGRLVGRILASVAAGEVERKSARQERASAQAAEQGLSGGGRRPFGFDDDRTTLRAAEAEALRRAYSGLIGGETLSGIARELNSAGFTTTVGGPWRHNAVRSMLLNPRNAGFRAYGPVGPDGRVQQREIVGRAVWEPIVDETTWLAACAILQADSRKTNRTGGARKWLLSNLAFCGACPEEARHRVISTYREHGRRVYRCSAKAHLLRSAPPIDELVSRVTIERLSRADARDLLSTPSDEYTALRQRSMELRALLDGLATSYAEGNIDLRQLSVGTKKLRSELEMVEERQVRQTRSASLLRLVESTDIENTWNLLDVDQKRATVNALWVVTILNSGPGRRVFNPQTVSIVPAGG